jgi:hypothetical protein
LLRHKVGKLDFAGLVPRGIQIGKVIADDVDRSGFGVESLKCG